MRQSKRDSRPLTATARRSRKPLAWLAKVSLALLTVAATLMALVSPAAAYWSGQGSGGGQARTTTLAAPTTITAAVQAGGSSNKVTWEKPTGLAPTGYYVTSTNSGLVSPACGTSPQAPTTAVICTDTNLSGGTYTYTVVAVRQSWSTSSVPSNSVTIASQNKLSVTAQPPTTIESQTKFGPVVIQLLSSTGAALKTPNVSITLKLNPTKAGSAAKLTGTLTATTAATGAATFNNLSVDLTDTYTLTATASGYGSVTTSSFSVTTGPIAAIKVVSGSGQSAPVGATFGQPLVARVTDAAGNPITNTKIEFRLFTFSGPEGTFIGPTFPPTDANGKASVQVQANSTPGTWVVRAWSYDNTQRFVDFTLTNTAAAAAAAKVAPSESATPSTPPSSASSPSSTPSPPAVASSIPPSASSAPSSAIPSTPSTTPSEPPASSATSATPTAKPSG